MSRRLPWGTRFIVPDAGHAKYVALVPRARGMPPLAVPFGDRRYQQWRDQVPVPLGGGQWRHLDHNDKARRMRYRKRARGQRCADGSMCYMRRLSPAWFSYHFLW